jgi:hypothetical protein
LTHLTFRGLVAFNFDNGEAIFVNPDPKKTQGHAHPAVMTLDLTKLAPGSGTPADASATLSDGTVVGLWEFTRVELNAGNVGENDGQDELDVDDTKAEGAAAADVISVRWLPTMSDIFGVGNDGAKPALDTNKVKVAKGEKKIAEGFFSEGLLRPVFDRDVNRTTCFDIGYRTCSAVADALRLSVKVRDEKQPTLYLTNKSGKKEPFIIAPGAYVELAAMPLKRGGDFSHMGHVFALRQGGSDDRPVTLCPKCPDLPSAGPIRCAPIMFP